MILLQNQIRCYFCQTLHVCLCVDMLLFIIELLRALYSHYINGGWKTNKFWEKYNKCIIMINFLNYINLVVGKSLFSLNFG